MNAGEQERLSAMTKFYATDVAMKVTPSRPDPWRIWIHEDYPVERMMRDPR